MFQDRNVSHGVYAEKNTVTSWAEKAQAQSRQSAKLFLQSSELGLPQPLTRRLVRPPGTGGGAHSLAREGMGESQFRRRDIHCGTLDIYVLCDIRAY
jgi:hypothetical protein